MVLAAICSDVGLRGSYRMLCLGKSILALVEKAKWGMSLWVFVVWWLRTWHQEEGWALLGHSREPNACSSLSPRFLASLTWGTEIGLSLELSSAKGWDTAFPGRERRTWEYWQLQGVFWGVWISPSLSMGSATSLLAGIYKHAVSPQCHPSRDSSDWHMQT